MQRDAEKLLRDMLDAASFILEQTAGLPYETYSTNRLLSDAVERNFITIGEAMNRLSRQHPDVAAQIDEHPQIISFRHFVVHGYDSIDPAVVWTIVCDHLPRLHDNVTRLLANDV